MKRLERTDGVTHKAGDLALETYRFPSDDNRADTLMHYSVDGVWLPDTQRCRYCGDWTVNNRRFCDTVCRERMSVFLEARACSGKQLKGRDGRS